MRPGTKAQALIALGAAALLACGGDVSPATATDSEGATAGASGETAAEGDLAAECPVATSLGQVSVVGTTPFGDFSGSYAAYGSKFGDCSGAILIAVVSDPERFLEQVSQPVDNDFLRPPPFDGIVLYIDRDAVGTGVDNFLSVVVMSGGESAWARNGAATLTKIAWTPLDDHPPLTDPWPVASGHFAIDDEGIALEGTFVAPLCGWLRGEC
ncbi:MAG: hypothetical protein R3A79_01990 [Nannocystaceae bacterium]